MKKWFNVHVFLGILSPLVILFHTGYSATSMNGKVALYSMFAVVISGIVGRYLLRHVHQEGHWRTLFKQWHIIHLPFIYLLILSAIIHIVSVHLY